MYTKKDILAQLKKISPKRDSVVILHASLRSIGAVEGGGEGLLDTMIEYFTAEGGLLCVPTHTWGNLGCADKPTLDMTAPWSNIGALASIAAADPRGLRTENPTHSVVIFGDRSRAISLSENEAQLITPTAPEGLYGKLFSTGGQILLVGVNQSKNTYLHAVAEILDLPNRMSSKPVSVTVKRASGEVVERKICLYDNSNTRDIATRFPLYDTAFRYHQCITDGFIGDAPAQLCDAVKMKETVELIFKNSSGEDPLADEFPIPPSLYCRT